MFQLSQEYLISREIVQETGVDSPQEAEDENAGSHQEVKNTAVSEGTLQDLMDSDKYTIEDTLRFLDVLAGETEEFMDKLPGITCSKSEVTCTKSEVTSSVPEIPSSVVSTKDETTGTSMEESISKDNISCTKNKVTCVESEKTCVEDESTRLKDKITRSEEEITRSNESVTCTKDKITCSTDDDTCTKDEVTCETREQNDTARDSTPVSIEIDLFNNSAAILNFEHIAMHCGLSRVILLF